MPILANSQHEKFAQEIVKGAGHGEAYINAGYKAKNVAVASAAATRLLKQDKIQARITELKHRAEASVIERTVLSRAWVIEKLIENVERAMQMRPVKDKDGKETGEFTYNGNVANRALELLGKEQGMFVDRKEIGNPGDFASASDDELNEIIAAEMQEVAKVMPKTGTKH